jgi:hypothetical protein
VTEKQLKMKQANHPTFSKIYPALAQLASGWDWIEIGEDGRMNTFVRALDERGMVKEVPIKGNLDKAIDKMEVALNKFMAENS